MTSVEELQHLYLPGSTKNAELAGQRRSSTSTLHNPDRKARSILLTTLLAGKDTPPHHLSVPAKAMAAQLLRKRKYEGADSESIRLLSRIKRSWRTPTVNISGDFTAAEFAAALPITKLMVGPTTAHKKRLQSRQPFASAARKLLN